MPTISGVAAAWLPGRGHPRLRDRRSASPRPTASIEVGQLEHAVRNVLNRTAPRRFARPRPAQGRDRELSRRPGRGDVAVANNPEDPAAGTRARSAFSRELWIERDDFMEEPAPKFFRLAPGTRGPAARPPTSSPAQRSSRTRDGNVVELRCTYDPATRGGDAPDGRRPKATLHWVSAAHAVPAEVRLYDHLFTDPTRAPDGDLFGDLNPDSETVLTGAFVEPVAGRTRRRARPCSSSASATSRPDPDTAPGAAGLQPDARRSRTRGPRSRPNRADAASKRQLAGCARGSRTCSVAGEWPNGRAPDSGSGG